LRSQGPRKRGRNWGTSLGNAGPSFQKGKKKEGLFAERKKTSGGKSSRRRRGKVRPSLCWEGRKESSISRKKKKEGGKFSPLESEGAIPFAGRFEGKKRKRGRGK